MNEEAVGKTIWRHINRLTFSQAFRSLALLYSGTQYSWGGESILTGADCSGLVCGPLMLLGYDVRTTANNLFHHIFCKDVDNNSDLTSPERVLAVFYLTNEEAVHGDQEVDSDYVTHVVPIVGRYAGLHADGRYGIPNQVVTTSYLHELYKTMNRRSVWRELDMIALKDHHTKKDLYAGPDPTVLLLRRG